VEADDGPQIGYPALPRGVSVYSSDGVLIGTVARVLENTREHIFDGIVVRTGGGNRFVDAPEVARITERRVTLTIDAAEAAELPEHPGTLANMGTSLRRTGRRWRRKLGR
jgi:hypothetical protein